MSKLIALVTVVAYVAGVRQEFAPGSELPELPEHDVKELKRMGSIEDLDETAALNKAQAKATVKASADFEAERKAIRAASESIEPSPAPPESVTTAKKR